MFVVGRVQPCACEAFTRLSQAIGTAEASVRMAALQLFSHGVANDTIRSVATNIEQLSCIMMVQIQSLRLETASLCLKKSHVWTYVLGSKGHEGHFYLGLEKVCYFGELRQGDRAEHTKVILEPCPRETVLYSLDRMWHSSCLRAVSGFVRRRRCCTGREHTASVSSMRRIHRPPVLRAKAWLNSAVRKPPRWRGPVGEGANRRRVLTVEDAM